MGRGDVVGFVVRRFFIFFLKIREEGGSVKEKFEEKVVKVCGVNLHDQSGRKEGGEGRRRVGTGSHVVTWGIKGEKGKGFFGVVFFYILRHETEDIVWRNRRRVKGKVEKIETGGN